MKISAGTDYLGQPGLLFKELKSLIRCGLSPIEAIRAATLTNAEVLGLEQQIGSIEKGKLADFLVVKSKPYQDISALQNLVIVAQSGKILINNRK
ncbi:amidohydrolase family protein [Alteromonas aquimaris]|uniref:amidohydrolase family protein n=1 Tax=Alteromonas aquimaris TaxID=2998417 RepID=UPI00387E5F96